MLIARPKLFIFTIIALFFCNHLSNPAWAADEEDARVDFVEVQLDIDGKIYEGLQDRIEFSITRVGEKILLDQPVALLTDNKVAVKRAIFNVFSKVLAGFKLEAVDLFIGKHTKILMHITPIPPVITNVRVNIKIEDINPEIDKLTAEVALKVETELNQVFVGLPVSSVSWSAGIFNTVINYLLEREFPGFSSRFSIQEGETTELNLTLIPEGQVVSSVTVDYSTVDIPVWLVKAKAKGYQSKMDLLKGIPVDFLIHYQSRLEKYLTEAVNDFSELRRLGLAVQLGIAPGVKTRVKLKVVSQYVQFRLEGRCFVSGEQDFSNIQTYLGFKTSDFEVYTKYYWGDNPSGNWKVGCGFPIDEDFSGGLEFEFEHLYRQVWLHYTFERGDYLDMKLGIDDSPNEATVGIYLNPHTNLELVNYKKDFGLQLMFHF
jgi:hypothetical protein